MATFQKREDCPTSQQLLAYQSGDIDDAEDARTIGRHLGVCEFCSAEVDFYERYPQAAEEPDEAVEAAEKPEMPEPLYELAEALLNKRSATRSMEKIINELEEPVERER